MTVRLESKINRYIGLSTDTKPYPGLPDASGHEATDRDIPPGSSFLEADTNTIWHWNGLEWIIGDNPEVVELKQIRGLLGAILERMSGSL